MERSKVQKDLENKLTITELVILLYYKVVGLEYLY